MCRSIWLIQEVIQFEPHLEIDLFMWAGTNDWTITLLFNFLHVKFQFRTD